MGYGEKLASSLFTLTSFPCHSLTGTSDPSRAGMWGTEETEVRKQARVCLAGSLLGCCWHSSDLMDVEAWLFLSWACLWIFFFFWRLPHHLGSLTWKVLWKIETYLLFSDVSISSWVFSRKFVPLYAEVSLPFQVVLLGRTSDNSSLTCLFVT